MNKKVFTGLVLLMAISILGIIAVQLIWVNNALKVKNELFNRSVNEALTNTVKKLEDIQNFKVISNLAFNDSIPDKITDPGNNIEEHIIRREKAKQRPVQIVKKTKTINGKKSIEISVDAGNSNQSSLKSYTYTTNGESAGSSRVVVSSSNQSALGMVFIVNDTVVTNIDSLFGISKIRIDSMLSELDSFSPEEIALSKRIRKKSAALKKMANQAVTEIYMWDAKEIDLNLLQKVLTDELHDKDIPIDFEFGINNNSEWDFPAGITDSAKLVNTPFKVNLYPNDIFQKNLKLAIFFPGRDSFVYRSLNWLLVASFLFSLFILITFSLSVFYILRQKKISEMKSDFINNMTHEFKTPIATISVASDSIVNEKVLSDPERIKYFAGMIKKENTRMNRQVEDILTIARLDKKDFEFNWEAVDIHELINDAIQGIILQVEKRGGKVDVRLDAVNPMVTTDKMHATNVVYNLLDNAIKYSAAAPEITVTTENQTNGVLISVTDRGIGMTKTVQGKIFERFYRQASGNIHNVKGFGLGLSYVKAVVEANHGTILVSSEPGKGSKFELFLPFIRA
jgi:two-component system phosphate regulon sensor histidine kinase PhoR